MKLNLIGQRFDRLVVIDEADRLNNRRRWLCKCDCGNTTICTTDNLRRGNSKSCGCILKEINKHNFSTHGMGHTRLNNIWSGMKTRCYNPNSKSYSKYGGRGIKVCDEWRNDFQSFYTWAMSHGYSDDLSIERIDVNGNYEPNNCCWITLQQQAQNKRTTVKVLWQEKEYTLVQLAEVLNENYYNIRMRYYRGTLDKYLNNLKGEF